MKEYRLLSADSLSRLEGSMNAYAEDGWQLIHPVKWANYFFFCTMERQTPQGFVGDGQKDDD